MKQFIVIILVASLAFTQEKTIKKDFDKAERIQISLNSGDVSLEKSSDSRIYVVVKHNYEEDDFKPTIEKRGNKIFIKEREKNGWGWNNRSNGESYWTISVPNGMEIEFNSGSGDMDVTDLSFSEFEGNTGSGDFKFTNTNGEVQINTGSGDIKYKNHKGDIELNSGSSDIELRDVAAEVRVNTGSGDIESTSLEGSIRINTGSGNIELAGLNLTDRSSANTGSGDVELNLASALKDDLEVSTGSGDITLNYDGNKIAGYFEFKAKYKNRIKTPFTYKTEKKVERYGNEYYLRTAEIGDNSLSVYLSTGSGVIKVEK